MSGATGSAPEPPLDKSWFQREVERERGIISQSNARSAAITQALSAVWTATGVVTAVILPRPNVSLTTASIVFGCLALLCFLVQLAAAAAILWPRGLGNLPHDETEEAYIQRLAVESAGVRANPGMPSAAECHEGYLLQRIRYTKEYATQVTLLAVLAYVPLTAAFFATLKY